ncbi:Subtilisin NAT [Polaribacter huanghezhanensis]|uniref:S8 family serine peptidase n=1 Tax=Polaribacter huanghezhanensis TaxID=1354726 RepID=UPI002647864D|nr:S8 family serine peptidase [Polaribacter huanghezhanensis]WKD86357.1 Subtilisin NAT [Polaribacter huanghezhanensis]
MKKLISLIAFLYCFHAAAQEDAWVFLKDKPNAATFLASPLTMLSQRALDRRTRQNIALDNKDVPMETTYYSQIKSATGITVLAKSKWLNAIHVQGTPINIKNLKTTYNTFVEKIEFADKTLNAKGRVHQSSTTPKRKNKFEKTSTTFNYGNATNQITMLKGDFLHQQGYTGTGMYIAVIDGGFLNVNTLAAFKRLRDNNQILGGYNFADRNTNFYTRDNHGTNVLSTIAGYIDGQFIGTSPDAKFYLFISEISETETVLEETLWVEAAEKADSLGVDVINTSLGYTTFDNANYNYTYADMDGKTTFISRGAEIGVSRGMILVNAAGNDGRIDNPWKYIGAPADVAGVFTVGAVNATGTIADFSSYGPTSDGRVKPDVLAQGQNVYVINHTTGDPVTSNGTSFSSPIMAGVVACFWQAFPNLTNTQIMQRIRESADRYNSPTAQYGYGIPNFENTYNTVLSVDGQEFLNATTVYPNPVTNRLTIKTSLQNLENTKIQIYNVIGKKVFQKNSLTTKTIDVSALSSGIYILKITNGNQQNTIKLIKK